MLDLLVRVTLDGAIVVLAIWLLNRALPRLSPSARALLWWCATAKFTLGLIWWMPVPLPLLPPADVASVAPTGSAAFTITTAESQAPASALTIEAPAARVSWTAVATVAWTCGVFLTAIATWRRWQRTRAACRSSVAAPPELTAMTDDLASRLGLRRAPVVRMSGDVPTPLVTGLRRPMILLPAARFAALSSGQQRMALCHELAHVKRGDLWLGCIPAVAQRLFFFHPLAHFAAREYGFWRESACDTSVLAALDVQPRDYGRLLLDLGVARPPATFAAAAAPWSFTTLKRRIVMLGQTSTPSLFSRVLTGTALIAAAAAVVPMQLVARSSAVLPPAPAVQRPVEESPQQQIADESPRQQRVGESPKQRTEETRYVMFLGEGRTMMSGTYPADVERAKVHRKGSESVLWFTHDGREYVIRDPGLLREAQALWDRVSTIGDQQGRIGAKQGALGAAQGEIGAKQSEIGVQQSLIGARQTVIATQQVLLSNREMSATTPPEKAAMANDRRGLEEQLKALDGEMRALDAKMRELDQPMRELGDKMSVLGDEMTVLGKQMEEASRIAERQMRTLFERAIATGAAQQIK